MNGNEDRLELFRQQASVIAKKKEDIAESLRLQMDEISKYTSELEEKENASKGANVNQ